MLEIIRNFTIEASGLFAIFMIVATFYVMLKLLIKFMSWLSTKVPEGY